MHCEIYILKPAAGQSLRRDTEAAGEKKRPGEIMWEGGEDQLPDQLPSQLPGQLPAGMTPGMPGMAGMGNPLMASIPFDMSFQFGQVRTGIVVLLVPSENRYIDLADGSVPDPLSRHPESQKNRCHVSWVGDAAAGMCMFL